MSFPEEVYSTDSDPYEILEENVASNQIDYAEHDINSDDQISRNDNDEDNQVFVDGFWIKEGMQLFFWFTLENNNVNYNLLQLLYFCS